MLHRTRYTECLRLIATVPGHELDNVARTVLHYGNAALCSLTGWTKRQLNAVRSLVVHGHLTGPFMAPSIDAERTIDRSETFHLPLVFRSPIAIVDDCTPCAWVDAMPEWTIGLVA